jgi:hypothetical protein
MSHFGVAHNRLFFTGVSPLLAKLSNLTHLNLSENQLELRSQSAAV